MKRTLLFIALSGIAIFLVSQIVVAESAQLVFDDFSSGSLADWGYPPSCWSISNNELCHYHETAPPYSEILTHDAGTYSDHSIHTKIKSVDGYPKLGVVGRFTVESGLSKFYMVYFTGTEVRLYKFVNPYYYLYGTVSFTLPVDEWVDVFFRIEGNQPEGDGVELIVFINGTQIFNVTDTNSNAPQSGAAGYYSYKGHHHFDDFEIIGDDGQGINYTELTSGAPVNDAVGWGYKKFYKVFVPQNATSLTIQTTNATDDIDLYARSSTPVSRYQFDFNDGNSTGNESITIDATTTPPLQTNTWYYILADGYKAAAYTITANVATPQGPPSASALTATFEDPGLFGRVRLDYTLTDSESDVCNFTTNAAQLQYSSNGVDNWQNGTTYAWNTNCSSSPGGVQHTITNQPLYWYAFLDIGFSPGTYYVRIKPHDGQAYASEYAQTAQPVSYDNPLSGDFSDDFTSSFSQWTIQSGAWSADGVFNQTNSTPGSVNVACAGDAGWHNYDYYVLGKYVLGEKKFGVRSRFDTSTQTYWDFYVEDSGSGWQLKLDLVINGTRNPVATYSDITVNTGDFYAFRSYFSGAYIRFIFGDQVMWSLSTNINTCGKVAVWTGGGVYAFDKCLVNIKQESDAEDLTNGEGTAQYVAKNQQKFYKIAVSPGVTNLEVTTTGSSDDIDLFLRHGSLPSITEYDYYSTSSSGDETISVPAPAAGDWYMLVDGYSRSEFTITASYNDTAPPEVTSVYPQNGALNVQPDENVLITFSEPMNPETINKNTILLFKGTESLPGYVTYDAENMQAVFNPVNYLEETTTYTVKVTTGVEDVQGNNMTEDYPSTFTTADMDILEVYSGQEFPIDSDMIYESIILHEGGTIVTIDDPDGTIRHIVSLKPAVFDSLWEGNFFLEAPSITISSTGYFNADGKGYGSGQGPGAGGSGAPLGGGGGGGYGGNGGNGGPPMLGGLGGYKYGSPHTAQKGSGGGAGNVIGGGPGGGGGTSSECILPEYSELFYNLLTPTEALGGAGGGVIIIKVKDTFNHYGRITANGLQGEVIQVPVGETETSVSGGSGSGGGILINADILNGTGEVRADGGNSRSAEAPGGPGGGGRIEVTYYSGNEALVASSVAGTEYETATAGEDCDPLIIRMEEIPHPLKEQESPSSSGYAEYSSGAGSNQSMPPGSIGESIYEPVPYYPFTEEIVTVSGAISTLGGCVAPSAGSLESTSSEISFTMGEPVYVHNGCFHRGETDLSIPGRGFSFRWIRTYKSQIVMNGPLGWNWDFNYNKKIKPKTGGNLLYFNGFGRKDEYTFSHIDGDYYIYYPPPGYYNILKKHTTNGTYELHQRNGAVFHFFADADGNQGGKLDEIIDRNGNTMKFIYGPAGELLQIRDTLYESANEIRKVLVFWNTSLTRIEKIRDWTGREINYAYYEAGDNDGSPGDLKTVTSPSTTQHPSGCTTLYTYSIGFVSPVLNHNLLTITKPNQYPDGPACIVNHYDMHDRVDTQRWGDGEETGGEFSFLYDNPYNPTKTTEIDRNGNYTDYFYNGDSQKGTADDNLTNMVYEYPNRNIRYNNPDHLGSQDPSGYLTQFLHSNLNHANGPFVETTKTYLPRGNSISVVYDRDNTEPLGRGNVDSIKQSNEGIENKPYAEITTSFTYYDSSKFNLVETIEDPLGRTTTFHYDTDGNLENIDYPEAYIYDHDGDIVGQATNNSVTFTYDATYNQIETATDSAGLVTKYEYYQPGESSYGYLKKVIVDYGAGGENLTNEFGYDSVGNVTSIKDNKQRESTVTVNALNQVTYVHPPSPYTHQETRYIYDANGNCTEIHAKNYKANYNKDAAAGSRFADDGVETQDSANPEVSVYYQYDILDNLRFSYREKSEGSYIVTEYQYDANNNLELIIQPEGNKIKIDYDERDLVYLVTDGYETDDASTELTNYNANGGEKEVFNGRQYDGEFGSGTGTIFEYDGLDRLSKVTDPEGNYTMFEYNELGQVKAVENWSYTAVMALTRTEYNFDNLGRLYHRDAHFMQSGYPTGEFVRTSYEYDAVTGTIKHVRYGKTGVGEVIDEVTYAYDDLYRLESVTDVENNVVSYEYDDNSNLERVVETEQLNGVGTETFYTKYYRDGLDRLKMTKYWGHVDNPDLADKVITTQWCYDSRNNKLFIQDAENNTSEFTYDALSRMTDTCEHMRSKPWGDAGNIITSACVNTHYEYDLNSRNTSVTDDNTKTTSYIYDDLNRMTELHYHSGPAIIYAYDKNSNLKTLTDQNQTVITYYYNAVDLLETKSISCGPGVHPTTVSETYTYDELYRLKTATNTPDPAYGNPRTVSFEYDTLGRIIETTQGSVTIAREFDGRGNRTKLTYPNSRIISYKPDSLNRIDYVYDGEIVEPPDELKKLAQYKYHGPGRVAERLCNNDTKLTVEYDSLKRVNHFCHTNTVLSPNDIACFRYDHDLVGNRQYEKRAVQGKMDLYTYDSLYRLTDYTRDANLDMTGGTVTHYELDGIGNRDWTQVGANPVVDYTFNELNQYTSVGSIQKEHDNNGNLTEDGMAWKLYYDYKDRLVKVVDRVTLESVAEYWYDCFGRRYEKLVSGQTTQYYYEGASVIEERDGLGGTSRQFVYGAGVDEVLLMIDGVGARYYYHTNSLGTVTHITSWQGIVIEEYRYDAYGNPTIYNDQGQVISESAINNPYMFTGRRYDKETGLYYYRARYYDPLTGRFLQRDPKGYVDGMGLYNYCGNNPANALDPFGMQENLDNPHTEAQRQKHDFKPDTLGALELMKKEAEALGEKGATVAQWLRTIITIPQLKKNLDEANEYLRVVKLDCDAALKEAGPNSILSEKSQNNLTGATLKQQTAAEAVREAEEIWIKFCKSREPAIMTVLKAIRRKLLRNLQTLESELSTAQRKKWIAEQRLKDLETERKMIKAERQALLDKINKDVEKHGVYALNSHQYTQQKINKMSQTIDEYLEMERIEREVISDVSELEKNVRIHKLARDILPWEAPETDSSRDK